MVCGKEAEREARSWRPKLFMQGTFVEPKMPKAVCTVMPFRGLQFEGCTFVAEGPKRDVRSWEPNYTHGTFTGDNGIDFLLPSRSMKSYKQCT